MQTLLQAVVSFLLILSAGNYPQSLRDAAVTIANDATQASATSSVSSPATTPSFVVKYQEEVAQEQAREASTTAAINAPTESKIEALEEDALNLENAPTTTGCAASTREIYTTCVYKNIDDTASDLNALNDEIAQLKASEYNY